MPLTQGVFVQRFHSIRTQLDKIPNSQPNNWHERPHSTIPALELPLDRSRKPDCTFRGATQSFVLPRHLSKALRTLSHIEATNLFTILLTSFKILLARYSSQGTISVGTPNASGAGGLPYEAMLPVCTDLSGNLSFLEALRRVRAVA